MVGEIGLFVLWCVTSWLFNSAAKKMKSDIAKLRHENEILGKAELSLRERIKTAELDARQTLEVAMDCQTVYKDHETRLRAIEGEPKAEPKPKTRTVQFRQFKAVVESLPEDD